MVLTHPFVRASCRLSTFTSKFRVKPLRSLGGGTGRGIREPLLTCSSYLLMSSGRHKTENMMYHHLGDNCFYMANSFIVTRQQSRKTQFSTINR